MPIMLFRNPDTAALHPEVRRARASMKTDIHDLYSPNRTFARTVMAAYILRCRAQGKDTDERPLATRPIAEREQEKAIQGIFRTIINDSLEPDATNDLFPERTCRVYEGACRKADVYFAAEFAGMSNQNTTHLASRFIMHDDQPVLMQKGRGTCTALSLRELSLGGVRYPVGSLFGIHVARDYSQQDKWHHPMIKDITQVPSSEVEGISFLRPSLFALPPTERPRIERSLSVLTDDFLMHGTIENIHAITAQNITP